MGLQVLRSERAVWLEHQHRLGRAFQSDDRDVLPRQRPSRLEGFVDGLLGCPPVRVKREGRQDLSSSRAFTVTLTSERGRKRRCLLARVAAARVRPARGCAGTSAGRLGVRAATRESLTRSIPKPRMVMVGRRRWQLAREALESSKRAMPPNDRHDLSQSFHFADRPLRSSSVARAFAVGAGARRTVMPSARASWTVDLDAADSPGVSSRPLHSLLGSSIAARCSLWSSRATSHRPFPARPLQALSLSSLAGAFTRSPVIVSVCSSACLGLHGQSPWLKRHDL